MLKGQHGQMVGSSMPRQPTTIMGTKPSFDPKKTQWAVRVKFGMKVNEVLTIGMLKKNMCYYTMKGTKGNSQ